VWRRSVASETMVVSPISTPWENVAQVLSDFAANNQDIKDFGFSVKEPNHLDNRIQLVTNWQARGEYNDYKVMWRVFFQVKRLDQSGQFAIAVRAQFGRQLRGADPSDVEYIGSDEDGETVTLSTKPSYRTVSISVFSKVINGQPAVDSLQPIEPSRI